MCKRGTFVNRGYTKRVHFLSKMVYKRVRGWTSGQSLPVENFLEYPPEVSSDKVLFDTKLNFSFVFPFCYCPSAIHYRKNCGDVYKSGDRISGVYTIDPDGSGAFDVYCDHSAPGGGWTVFQKRLDGSVDFYRGWNDYKLGFGNLNGEFWLGLDKIYRLTKSERCKLRVDLEDTAGKTAYAEYDMFAVTSERTKYQLGIGTYSGLYALSEQLFINQCIILEFKHLY